MGSEMVAGTVHPSLRPYVKRFTGFRERDDAPALHRETPFGGVAVILALEESWKIRLDDGPVRRYRSFAGGLIDRPAFSQHDGVAHTLQFDLTPLGCLALLGVPGAQIAGQVVALDDLLGADADWLVDELVHTDGWDARFALLNRRLRERLDETLISPDVEWSWRRLTASRGATPIAELTRELGCSSRHLSRRFAHDIGMTPKRYARLVRFENATTALQAGDDDLGVIAVRAGYFDQAHFNRDVTAFAGVSPGELRAEL